MPKGKSLPGFSDGGLEHGKFYSVRDAGMAWGGKVGIIVVSLTDSTR